jgi:hypothetical protein
MTSATSPDPRALMSCPEESSDNFGGITWNPHDEFREKKPRFRMPKSSPILMAINHQSRWLVYDCFTNINPKKNILYHEKNKPSRVIKRG